MIVLHIFAPTLKERFGGQSIRWKRTFHRWDDKYIFHKVLDVNTGQIIDANSYFDFQYTEKQKISTRFERFLWILKLFFCLLEYRSQYDILHVHVLWWGSLLLGPWTKIQKKTSIYESILLDSDTPAAIEKEALGKIKNFCLRQYTGILSVSDYLAEEYLRYGFRKDQVFSLINPVDVDIFHPVKNNDEIKNLRRELSLPQEAKIAIFVGTVKRRKGIHDLVDAFIEAKRIHPNLYLLVIGPYSKSENPSIDEGYVKYIFSRINDYQLSHSVSFIGFIQDEYLLSKYYRASDLFIFPSRREGMPNVVLEAMASGLPIIVTELPIFKNLITNLKNGLTIPISSKSGIIDAITFYLNDELLANKISQNASSTIARHYSHKSWQENLKKYYYNLSGIGI